MLDLEYWANPEKYIDNYMAIFWSTKNIIVPVAEKEVLYKNFVYNIDGLAYESLCDARRDFGYEIDYIGKCKNITEAQNINAYFISCMNSIKKEIENSEKENRKCGLNYPRLKSRDSISKIPML